MDLDEIWNQVVVLVWRSTALQVAIPFSLGILCLALYGFTGSQESLLWGVVSLAVVVIVIYYRFHEKGS